MNQTARKQHPNYQAAVCQVNEGMVSLLQVCSDLGLQESVEVLNTIRDRMENRVFSVGIMGEFKRGKSTVINSLLGKNILPADVLPTTAAPTHIRWDTRPRAIVHFKDGTEKEVGIGDLSSYVTMLNEESEAMCATVEAAMVYCPCEICRNGVEIVDTPGFNLDKRMDKISRAVIPKLDAAVMVISASSPFSKSEAELVRRMLMSSDLRRLVFLVNRIDTIPEGLRQQVLEATSGKIQKTVDEIAAVYGADSNVYQDAQNKISGIRIFSSSALTALEGQLDGNSQMVKESGILEFEEVLSHLLTEERVTLDLVSPVNSMLFIAKEAHKSITIRRGALEMDPDELKRFIDEAEEAIRVSHEQKIRGLEALKYQTVAFTASLQPELAAAYNDIEQRLVDYVEHMHNFVNPLNRMAPVRMPFEETEARIRQFFSEEIGKLKLMVKIQNQVTKDVEGFLDTAEKITTRLDSILKRLAPKKDDSFDLGTAADTFIPETGFGSFINDWEGYALPDAAEDACAAIKNTLILHFRMDPHLSLTSVRQAMNAIRTQKVLERRLSDIVMNVYNSWAGQIDRKMENILIGFTETLIQLKPVRQKQESDIVAIQASMDRLERQLIDIEETIQPLQNLPGDHPPKAGDPEIRVEAGHRQNHPVGVLRPVCGVVGD